MFISHNNVASGVLIFLFTIFRVTLAINLEYRTSEILRINQYIGNYTQWLIANGPFHHKVIDKPMVNCLDIAISYSEKTRSSLDMLQLEYEEYFATTLFHEMFAERKMSIKNRSKFARFEEKYFCHYFMVISFNETQLFQDIQQWSLTRKSKYLIVVFPYDIINFNRNSSKTIRDPMQWPIQHVFTHAQVMLVVNYDIYKLSSPFNAEMSQLIKISVEKFKAWEPHNLLVSDFQGKRLMVSTLHCPPQNYWNDDRSSVGVDTPGAMETMCNEKELSRHYENNFGMKTCRKPDGIEGNIMRALAQKLNFTWQIHYPLEGEYGSVKPDGSEDGMVGEAHFGRVHLIFCNIWVQYPRNILIEFSTSFFETCLTFLVPRPILLPHRWSSIFNWFSQELWIGLLSVFTVFLLLSWVFGKINNIAKNSLETLTTDEIFFELIAILTTGSSIPDSTITGYSILLTSWSIFCLNIIAIYSSELVSALTVPQFTPRIDSSEAFAAANLTWGTFRMTDFDFLLDIKQPAHQKMRANFQYESFDHPEAIERQVNGGRYAILMTNFGGAATVQLGINDFPVMKLRLMKKQCLYKPFAAFGFPNNSPYRPAIDRMLVRLFETGTHAFLKKRAIREHHPLIWESMFVESDTKSDSSPEILTIKHLHGAFLVLSFGLVIAFLSLFGEIIIFKMKNFMDV